MLIFYICSAVNCCYYGKKMASHGHFVFFPIWVCGHGESILKTGFSDIFNSQGKVY